MSDQNRQQFREQVFERDDSTCVVPWCGRVADDAHHILERSLWADGGYIPKNGASVCNVHHRYAEVNDIPPQAFWQWIGVQSPPTPTWDEATQQKMLETWGWLDTLDDGVPEAWNVDKWGEPFNRPPHEHLRERIKYPSSRHLLPLYWYDETSASERIENDDTELQTIEPFVGTPLVITEKIDGGNCMLVSDMDTPVRARNGSDPRDTMEMLYKPGGLYWQQEVNQKLPDNLQVFGEWVYAKHSIHYGCDCSPACEDTAPGISEITGVDDDRAYFQIFGVFNTDWNTWLSWPTTEQIAQDLGFPTTPVLYHEDANDTATFETEHKARQTLLEYAHDVVERGGEGIIVRNKFPFHYGQFSHSLGKYVRENHVTENDIHWSKRTVVENRL